MKNAIRTAAFLVLFVSAICMGGEVVLTGTGATFPYHLYKKWIEVYSRQHDTVSVLYEPTGSGSGIKSLVGYKVDFGATDVSVDQSNHDLDGDTILHLPTCIGAIVVTYNLPGNPALKLTSEQVADLFMGRIVRWNDKRIRTTNPEIALPDMPVVVVHRSESSGSTAIFTRYLTESSIQWKNKVGNGKKVNWPTGLGVEGNPGVAEMIRKISGSIGYVVLNYAEKEKLPHASIQNRHGEFIDPSVMTVSASANRNLPSDFRTSLTGDVPRGAYPISAFTYIIVRQEQAYAGRTYEQSRHLADFLWWAIHDGQQYADDFLYAPLPARAVAAAENIIKGIRFNGKVIKCVAY